MIFTFPWPTKALSPNWRGHWAQKSAAVKAYRTACKRIVCETATDTLSLPPDATIGVLMRFYPPSKRKYDWCFFWIDFSEMPCYDSVISSKKGLIELGSLNESPAQSRNLCVSRLFLRRLALLYGISIRRAVRLAGFTPVVRLSANPVSRCHLLGGWWYQCSKLNHWRPSWLTPPPRAHAAHPATSPLSLALITAENSLPFFALIKGFSMTSTGATVLAQLGLSCLLGCRSAAH